ncbi:hypothetical protein C2S51_028920 [Perilla frutescens var. frutescens]|nr:hypothetical protein C2S51_028920 [Perilla frutescens var. frutescens]
MSVDRSQRPLGISFRRPPATVGRNLQQQNIIDCVSFNAALVSSSILMARERRKVVITGGEGEAEETPGGGGGSGLDTGYVGPGRVSQRLDRLRLLRRCARQQEYLDG